MHNLTQKAGGQDLHNSLFLAPDLSAYLSPYGVERCLEENQVSAEMFPTGMAMRCNAKERPPLALPSLWQESLVLILKMHGCAFQCRMQDRYGIQDTGYRTGCRGGRVAGRRQNKPALNISRDNF